MDVFEKVTVNGTEPLVGVAEKDAFIGVDKSVTNAVSNPHPVCVTSQYVPG